jgi:hypothetical protein
MKIDPATIVRGPSGAFPGMSLAGVLTEPWPEGVVARYLTAAWASVDVYDVATPSTDATKHTLTATCTGEGCDWGLGWDEQGQPSRVYYIGPTDSPGRYRAHLYDMKLCASGHAEECRAMRRPA